VRHDRVQCRAAPLLVVALVAAALLSPPWVASGTADTIYLKNGRRIDTASATVEGDRVLFLQFGHPVAIPMSEVERVEQNDRSGPDATPAPPPSAAAAPTGQGASASSVAAPDDPQATKEYWQDRVRAINAAAGSLKLELQQLRRIERAFLFSHRSTADTRRQIEGVQARIEANDRALPELRREARRKGVPPGWLRLPRGG